MTAKTILVAAGAFVALGISPALAGSGCSGYGTHASTPETIAQTDQSTPADATTQTAIPYPLPTTDEDTLTASVAEQSATTTE